MWFSGDTDIEQSRRQQTICVLYRSSLAIFGSVPGVLLRKETVRFCTVCAPIVYLLAVACLQREVVEKEQPKPTDRQDSQTLQNVLTTTTT